jgi:hypothetical protein
MFSKIPINSPKADGWQRIKKDSLMKIKITVLCENLVGKLAGAEGGLSTSPGIWGSILLWMRGKRPGGLNYYLPSLTDGKFLPEVRGKERIRCEILC